MSGEPNHLELYLTSRLQKLTTPQHRSYLLDYNLMRIKRFLMHSLMAFVFQYLTIINLTFSYPPLPLYPPIGIAFVTFYLCGSNVVFGLFLGGLTAYYLKGLSLTTILLYSMADLGCGCLGAILCQSIFSSDIKPFANKKEAIQFITINAFITCLLSGLLRIMALVANKLEVSSFKVLFYYYIDLWLADLNALLLFSGFILSWVYIPFCRDQILKAKPPKTLMTLLGVALITFVVSSVIFIQEYQLIYFLVTGMLLSCFAAYFYGYLIATGLSFILSSLYLIYFIAHKNQYFLYFGIESYTLIPIFLLVYIIGMLYISDVKFNNKCFCQS